MLILRSIPSFRKSFVIALGLLAGAVSAYKPWKGSETITSQSFLYGAFEARIRAAKGGGIITPFFLYKDGSENSGSEWEEMDFEIFGRDGSFQSQVMTPGKVAGSQRTEHVVMHYPSTPAFNRYNTYRMEWTPDSLCFYFNGNLVRKETDTAEFGKLIKPSRAEPMHLRVSNWGANNAWSGAFDSTAAPSSMFVNWIQTYSYTPGAGPNGSNFTPLWRDDFDSWNSSRWWTASWTFDPAINDYVSTNATVRDSVLQQAFTYWTDMGVFQPTPTDDGLTPPLVPGFVVDSTPVVVPATMAANKFVTSLDLTKGNSGDKSCRPLASNDVDLKIDPSDSSTCYLTSASATEWIQYNINSPTDLLSDIVLKTGAPYTSNKIQVLLDGVAVGVPLEVAATGATTWGDLVFRAVPIPAGNHTLRVVFVTGGVNLKSVSVRPTSSVISLPGRIPAEAYVAYSDLTSGNYGGRTCRIDDVDIAPATDTGAGCYIGWTQAGEWVDYLVKADSAGYYEMSFRLAANSGTKTVQLLVDGVPATTVVSPTLGWDTYGNAKVGPIALSAGPHRFRIQFVTGNANFHYLDVFKTGAPPDSVAGLAATAGNRQVDLLWNSAARAVSYKVLRGSDTIATVSAPSYRDSGLVNGTTYSYSIVAVNAYGKSVRSAIATATPKAPEAPMGPSTLSGFANDGSVNLVWAAVPNALSYKVYRSTNDTTYAVIASGLTDAQYLDASVANGVTYHYYVTVALAGQPESKPSPKAALTPIAEIVPQAPLGFGAVAGEGFVSLSWLSVSDARSYSVYRTDSAGSTRIAVGLTGLGFVDSAVFNGTTYQYAVTGVNRTKEGPLSAIVSATPDYAVPARVSGVVGTAGDRTVSLAWDSVVNATAYRVVRLQADTVEELQVTGGLTFQDSGLTNGTTYRYLVQAIRITKAGAFSDTVVVAPRLSAPGVPSALTATAEVGGVKLSWRAAAHAASYAVYRATAGIPVRIATTAGTSFRDLDVVAGTTYTYSVSGLNGSLESDRSDSVQATPGALAAQVATVSAVASPSTVVLTWAPSAGATGYKVLRASGTDTLTAVAKVVTPAFTDTGLINGTTYVYSIVATNAWGDAAGSVPVSALPDFLDPGVPTALVAVAGNGKVSLSWASALNDQSFRIYRASGSGAAVKVGSVTGSTWVDTSVVNGTSYTYSVSGVNGSKESLRSSEVLAQPKGVAPAKVVGLVASAGNAKVALNWSAASGSTGYKVVRGTDTLATTSNTSFTDTLVTNKSVYSYSIVAFNSWGLAAASASVSATPTAPSASLKAQYQAGIVGASTNGIRPLLKVVNTGTVAVPLSQVTVRYWFTNDGTQSLSYWCDWAQIGSTNLTGTFYNVNPARTGADRYLEIAFKTSAGSLAPGASTGDIQSRFSKSDWSNFTQTNDASYDATKASAYADWSKVTVYVNGELVWGVEP